jgi:hypothetical protein
VRVINDNHVLLNILIEIQEKFQGRKEETTGNVLVAINFDLRFTYVLARWEGSVHDSRVLGDAILKSSGLKIQKGIK